MDINFSLLAYLVVTIACMSVLLYATIKQYKETRRPRNSFTALRWRLFFLPAVILFGLFLGLPRLLTILFPSLETNQLITVIASQPVRVMGGIIVLVGITWLILGIYTFKEKQ